MGKNTSISLGNYFEEFISEEIKSGRYSSVSELIRSALRLLEREEKKELDVDVIGGLGPLTKKEEKELSLYIKTAQT